MRKTLGLLVILMALAGISSADPIHWTLTNVRFTDGGAATGFFDYDDVTDTLSAWGISVSGGNVGTFPAMTYDTTTSYNFDNFDAFGSRVINIDNHGGRQIRFAIPLAFIGTGGAVNMDITNGYAGECYNCSPYRAYEVGALQGGAVPEPGSLAILALGTGVLFRRRRT